MSMASFVTTDTKLKEDFDARVPALTARITPVQEKINKSAISDADKAALAAVAAARADVRGQGDRLKELVDAGDAAAKQAFLETVYRPKIMLYLESIDKFVALQERQRDEAVQAAQVAGTKMVWVAGTVAVVLILLGMGLATLLVRSVTEPLDRAVDTANAIAAGDLTRELQTSRKDELGQMLRALSDMSARLRGVVSEVRPGVDSVSSASIEIANGNHDLSARTEQTAANLEETASSMEELTATVTQSADTARQANQLAGTAAQAAARGGEVVGQVVTSMQQSTDSTRKISDIIGVIDGIAFQTNILALNAAVEAARAGEQGRGFAVVATEVRNLAQRSAAAAKEIKGLISDSVEKVEAGNRLVDQAGRTMEDVVTSIKRVAKIMGDISDASREQSSGIEQVSLAVSQMDEVTQQNAALVEEAAAAAESLEEQAHNLSSAVSIFKLDDTAAAPRLSAPGASQRSSAQTSPRGERLGGRKQPALPTSLDDEWEEF